MNPILQNRTMYWFPSQTGQFDSVEEAERTFTVIYIF